MLLEYPLTKESLQLEQSLQMTEILKSIFYTRWLHEFKNPQKTGKCLVKLSFIPSLRRTTFSSWWVGYIMVWRILFEIYRYDYSSRSSRWVYFWDLELELGNIHHEGVCKNDWNFTELNWRKHIRIFTSIRSSIIWEILFKTVLLQISRLRTVQEDLPNPR